MVSRALAMLLGVGCGRKVPKVQQGSPCLREEGGLYRAVSPRLHASSVYPGGLHLTLTL